MCWRSRQFIGQDGQGRRGATVDFYSSLPLSGSSTAQTVPALNGIKLALKQAGNKAGSYTIKYTSLNDATAAAGQWTAEQTSADARKAATDPKAVYYMGEFNSGASEVSMPILNDAGIAQDSPANTYVGLTASLNGVTAPGEPEKYFPTGKRTYTRIVPLDTIQGAADLDALKPPAARSSRSSTIPRRTAPALRRCSRTRPACTG